MCSNGVCVAATRPTTTTFAVQTYSSNDTLPPLDCAGKREGDRCTPDVSLARLSLQQENNYDGIISMWCDPKSSQCRCVGRTGLTTPIQSCEVDNLKDASFTVGNALLFAGTPSKTISDACKILLAHQLCVAKVTGACYAKTNLYNCTDESYRNKLRSIDCEYLCSDKIVTTIASTSSNRSLSFLFFIVLTMWLIVV